MALCCIGGVCIPYTAIVPFMILGLKWIFEKLVAAGLIPAALQEKATALLNASSSNTSATCSNGSTKIRRGKKTTNTACSDVSCCTTDSSISTSSKSADNGPGVIFVNSLDEWNDVVHSSNTVICKMTASWCKPCKVIQPIFEDLASKNKATFCVVDVDELDEVAAKHRVAILPTFLVIGTGKQGEKELVLDRYSGSNEQKLCDLVAAAVAQ